MVASPITQLEIKLYEHSLMFSFLGLDIFEFDRTNKDIKLKTK